MVGIQVLHGSLISNYMICMYIYIVKLFLYSLIVILVLWNLCSIVLDKPKTTSNLKFWIITECGWRFCHALRLLRIMGSSILDDRLPFSTSDLLLEGMAVVYLGEKNGRNSVPCNVVSHLCATPSMQQNGVCSVLSAKIPTTHIGCGAY